MSDNEPRKAPRAPGKSFVGMLKDYSRHPVPDYLLFDKSEWLGDEEIGVDRYLSREVHGEEKARTLSEPRVFPRIKKSDFSLREVKVGRWGGFVFINIDPTGRKPLER